MPIRRIAVAAAACLSIVGLFAWAQNRKAGLWEVTSNMTWQQSPLPPGTTMPAGTNSTFAGGSHTTEICVTQDQIDKFGTAPPQTQRSCQVTNIVKKPNGMTAELICTAPMAGRGDIEASWTDDSHTSSKMHFTGNMQMGPNPKTIEWTIESTSVYKGTECGNVKPFIMPTQK